MNPYYQRWRVELTRGSAHGTREARQTCTIRRGSLVVAVGTHARSARHAILNARYELHETRMRERASGKRRLGELSELMNVVANRHWAHPDMLNGPDAGEARTRTAQALVRLQDCYRMARLMGGETLDSFERCLRSFAGGNYRLYPDSEALCLNFTVAGMYGGMIFFESTRTWSLHT